MVLSKLTPAGIVLGDTDFIEWLAADYEFIAAARTDVPDLIAAVRELQAERDAPSMTPTQTIESLRQWCERKLDEFAKQIPFAQCRPDLDSIEDAWVADAWVAECKADLVEEVLAIIEGKEPR